MTGATHLLGTRRFLPLFVTQLLGFAGLGVVELLGVETRVSLRVVFLPLASASAAGLTFGILPAWRASQVEPLAALQGAEPS